MLGEMTSSVEERADAVPQQQPVEKAAPQAPVNPEDAPPQLEVQPRIRDYFTWRPLPWWLVFLIGIFLFTKFQIVYNDSPCAILGTQGPVGKSEINKAFRTISMCTHPDRLRGRLQRAATTAEERRGEILFNRASAAKDELTHMLKGNKKKVPCYQGELELAVLAIVTQAALYFKRLGVSDYVSFFTDLFWNIVTFEAGFMNTILSCLWGAFVLRTIRGFLGYLWRMGIIRFVLSLVTTVIIGPIPTVVHFLILPPLRFYVFLRTTWASLRPEVDEKKDDDAAAETNGTGDADSAEPAKPKLTAAMRAAAEANKELPNRGIRQRKKKDTDEERAKKCEEQLKTAAPEAPVDAPAERREVEAVPGGRMPEGLWKCINWTVPEPIKARQNAANSVQFDLLLILTKPIIPLAMLVSTGQVWNGLFSSLITGHALRKWVPQMSYEAHHLLIMFFGAVHTLLGVSAQQVEDYANRETSAKVLHLAWAWSFKDVLCVLHMALLGASVKAMSSLGNEPTFSSSFAAGIALRIALAQDSVKGLSVFSFLARKLEGGLRDMGIQLVASEEVVAYSGDGIGDCGGGPFRMLFGDALQAAWAARALKVFIMVLPLMATGQWLLRTIQAGKMLGRRRKTTRFVQRLILFIMGLLQVILLFNVELNASHGALGNFWIAMMFGCIGESLLCTYDVRGNVRQIVFLLLFLVI